MYQKRDARSVLLKLMLFGRLVSPASRDLRACLRGGVGPQIGEVTCGGSPHLLCKRDQIKMRDYMDRRVTSPTWGPPPPCEQALRPRPHGSVFGLKTKSVFFHFAVLVWMDLKTEFFLKTITSRCWMPVNAHAPINDGSIF